jgi:hypothetical protein
MILNSQAFGEIALGEMKDDVYNNPITFALYSLGTTLKRWFNVEHIKSMLIVYTWIEVLWLQEKYHIIWGLQKVKVWIVHGVEPR